MVFRRGCASERSRRASAAFDFFYPLWHTVFLREPVRGELMTKLTQELRSQYSSNTLTLAATIGDSEKSVAEKIVELFGMLGDPLLSGADAHALLALKCDEKELDDALAQLVSSGTLEFDLNTCRPLEEAGTKLFRLVAAPWKRLTLFAQQYDLGRDEYRYQFGCDGRLIRLIARIDRLDALASSGNQREEIRKHVNEIRSGLESGNQVPNSVILVLNDEMVSEVSAGDPGADIPESHIVIRPVNPDDAYTIVPHPVYGDSSDFYAQKLRTVEVSFPFRVAAFDHEKSVLLVDGQQRTAALDLADIEKCPQLMLSVNAIRATDDDAKDIFQIANSTVKINADFKRALLATMDEAPGYLKSERNLALAVKTLAVEDTSSPFHGIVAYQGIKYAKKQKPPVAYNSLFAVVRNFAEGSLQELLNSHETLAEVVKRSYSIVKKVWPADWGKSPKENRLMHGAGIRSLGDLILTKVENRLPDYGGDILSEDLWVAVDKSIQRLREHLVWSDDEFATAAKAVKDTYKGYIDGVQNTEQDIARLTKKIASLSLELDIKAEGKPQAKKKS
jgi:DGQHR domain-containing protein